VQAAIAARDYNNQSLEAEQKKLGLGASTTSLVLQEQRSLATAEFNLIAAQALYAKDRAAFYQTLASTLQHYGINLNDAATGEIKTAPVITGLQPAKDTRVAPTAPPSSR
jgi:outer membrane protein TolC